MTIPLFPVDVAREITSGLPNSADLKVVSVGRDGLEYATKRQADGVDLPASEWFCYHLGYRLQIALPQCAVLRSSADEHFGSRFEGGIIQWSNIPPTEQYALLLSCAADISRIYALDLFVANDDRHLNNFLFRNQTLAGQRTVIAMDFSRGLLIRGWPHDPVPMPASTNTMMQIGMLKTLGVWSSSDATLTLSSIATVTSSEVKQWLKAMPDAWLSAARIDEIVKWWESPGFGQRLAECGILV
jgi:hypothetical protein